VPGFFHVHMGGPMIARIDHDSGSSQAKNSGHMVHYNLSMVGFHPEFPEFGTLTESRQGIGDRGGPLFRKGAGEAALAAP